MKRLKKTSDCLSSQDSFMERTVRLANPPSVSDDITDVTGSVRTTTLLTTDTETESDDESLKFLFENTSS